MFDDQTMRGALGAVTFTVLVLFYLGVYRPTRSSFSGWWCMSLLLAGAATALLIFDDSAARVVTYPVSAALAAAGATCVWFAARSLRRRTLPRWLLYAGPATIMVPVSMVAPDESGAVTTGPVAVYMAAMFFAGAVEAWLAWSARRASAESEPNGEALVALLVIAVAATGLSMFYAVRLVMLVVVGRESEVFELAAGSGTEDVALLVCMVAVTFSVSAVGWDQQTQHLRRRAMRDDLTGLLGRSEFRVQVEQSLEGARSGGASALLVVADLDHFKDINDTHGHAAGDGALMVFAAVLTSHLRPGECAGRLGGEEFGLVIHESDDADVLARLRAISDDFATRSGNFDFSLPTVSYGIAGAGDAATVAEVFECADLAMYRAKADGRDRAVRYSRELGWQPGRAPRRGDASRARD
ncbi:MAG: GGDEF domain-containing protein [Demequina sp.]